MKFSVAMKLTFLALAAAALAACGAQGSADAQTVENQENHTAITHIGIRNFVGGTASGPDGVYEVAWLRPGACNLLYLDAASQKEIFLCSAPNCAHDTEACSSYLPVKDGGYGYSLFFYGDHLYAIEYASSDTRGHTLLEISPDGSQRKELLTLNSGERFSGTVFGYGDSILMEISVTESDGTAHTQLEQVDCETGARQVVFSYPHEKNMTPISLMGAAGTNLVYLFQDYRENDKQYYLVDLSQGSAAIENWKNTPLGPTFDDESLICTIQGDYFCTYDRDQETMSYEDLITGSGAEFPVPELAPEYKINSLFRLYDDCFALSVETPDGTRDVLLDPDTHTPSGVEYAVSRDNSIDIVGKYGDQLIYTTRVAQTDLIDQDKLGLSGEIAYYNVYVMVNEEDFENGTLGQEIAFPDLQ